MRALNLFRVWQTLCTLSVSILTSDEQKWTSEPLEPESEPEPQVQTRARALEFIKGSDLRFTLFRTSNLRFRLGFGSRTSFWNL